MKLSRTCSLLLVVALLLILGISGYVYLHGNFKLAASASEDTCTDFANTLEFNTCEHARLEKAQQDLELAYESLIKTAQLFGESSELAEMPASALQKAQLAWISFVDQQCAAESVIFEGGSIQSGIWSKCMAMAYEQRIHVLKKVELDFQS